MRSLSGRIMAVAWSGILSLLILVFGAGVWAALVARNLRTSLAVPWAVPVWLLSCG